MAYVMTLLNQKGGIGKTTASVQIGVGLRRRGYKVLLIDMDPQCNLTFSLGGDYQESPTIMEAILNEADVNDCIQHLDECDIIPSSTNLSTIDSRIEESGKEFMLVDAIKNIKYDYDYIILDSPPTLSLLTISIMVVADGIIIPANLDMYSLQGIGQLYRTYEAVKTYCNDKLQIEGILITKSARTLKKTLIAVAAEFGIKVFDTEITNSPLVVNATIEQKSLYKLSPNARVTRDYYNFVTELLESHNKETGEEVIPQENTVQEPVMQEPIIKAPVPKEPVVEVKKPVIEVPEIKKEDPIYESVFEPEYEEDEEEEPIELPDLNIQKRPKEENIEKIIESAKENKEEVKEVIKEETVSEPIPVKEESVDSPEEELEEIKEDNNITNLEHDTINNKVENKVYKELEELFDED